MTALTCVFHTQQKKQLRVKYLKYLCNDGLIETISCASRHKSLDSIDASTLTLYVHATEHKQREKRERGVEEEQYFFIANRNLDALCSRAVGPVGKYNMANVLNHPSTPLKREINLKLKLVRER